MEGALNGRVPHARPHWPIGPVDPLLFSQEVAVIYVFLALYAVLRAPLCVFGLH